MKPVIFATAMTLMASFIYAQEVQWASEVIDFSSQLSEYQYSATQVLGNPDVLPDYGDNPNAWLPARPNRLSYIKVGYEQPMRIRQLAIGESFNPGALYQVFLYDLNDTEYLLNTFVPRPLTVQGRMLNIYLSETEFPVKAVKIVLDGSQVAGYNGIDAIGISGTTIPIVATKDVAFRRNPGLETNFLALGAEQDVSDSRPVYELVSNTLFFTRGDSPRNVGGEDDLGDIWRSSFDSNTGQFTNAESLGEGINNAGYNSTNDLFFENGQRKLLLGNVTGSSSIGNNVVKVDDSGGSWGNVEELRMRNARIASIDADYTISENDSVMIIATLRYDTEGGRDLYIVRQEKSGRWSEPRNLGGNINTTMDEYAPFYSVSEKALYFATNGYPGFGGSDIFRTVRLDDSWENWSTPENIGVDINTSADEQYFYFDDADEYAFFARMNEDSIYAIVRVLRPVFLEKTPMVAVRGNVTGRETNRPMNSVISVDILPEVQPFSTTISDQSTGAYEVRLPSGNEFKVVSEKEGYEPFETTLVLENRGVEYTYDLDIEMGLAVLVPDEVIAETDEVPEEPEVRPTPPPDTEPEDFYEITFEFDSYKILDESKPVIDFLVDVMDKHPDLLIELAGYTDQIGNEKYNYRLSRRRSEAVKNYMVSKGIDEERIIVLGFGEWMPLISGKDKDKNDLRMNRRVEYNFTRE